jgi:hypothetical protein
VTYAETAFRNSNDKWESAMHTYYLRASVALLGLGLLVSFAIHVSAQEKTPAAPWVEMRGETFDGVTRLYWITRKWSAALDGFVIKRCIKDESNAASEWHNLSASTIEPGFSPDKDLSNVESDPKERKRLAEKYPTIFPRDTEAALKLAESIFKKGLANINDDERFWINYGIVMYFDMAMLTGFGFVDRDLPANIDPGRIEYGLFPVMQSRGTAIRPAAVFIPYRFDDKAVTPQDVQLVPDFKGRFRLDWRLQAALRERFSVKRFNVYRQIKGSDRRTQINRSELPMEGRVDEKGIQHFSHVDRDVDPSQTVIYTVKPVNAFDREFDVSATLEVSPESLKSADSPPKTSSIIVSFPIIRVSKDEHKNFVVVWQSPRDLRDSIDKVVVERVEISETGRRLSSQELVGTAKQYIDKQTKTHGNQYSFRVLAFGKSKLLAQSTVAVARYNDPPKPPQPTNLQAKLSKRADGFVVDLSWDPIDPDDKLTRGFVVFTDTFGTLKQNASIRPFKEPRYRHTSMALHGKELTIGIGAISKEGAKSRPTTVKVYIPGRNLPRVEGVTRTPDETDPTTVTVAWKFPEMRELKGFRLYQDDKLIADEDKITEKLRSWRITNLVRGKLYRFSVEAASRYDTVSFNPISVTYRPPTLPTTVLPPTDLSGVWNRDVTPNTIELSWKPEPESKPAKGYRIRVDRDEIDVFEDMTPGKLVEAEEYTFSPPDDSRPYAFYFHAVDESGKISVPRRLIVLTENGLPTARFSGRTIDPNDKSKVTFPWTYPDLPNLKGFRIYVNGERVADETILTKATREFTLESLQPLTRYSVEIEAITTNGETSSRGRPAGHWYRQ